MTMASIKTQRSSIAPSACPRRSQRLGAWLARYLQRSQTVDSPLGPGLAAWRHGLVLRAGTGDPSRQYYIQGAYESHSQINTSECLHLAVYTGVTLHFTLYLHAAHSLNRESVRSVINKLSCPVSSSTTLAWRTSAASSGRPARTPPRPPAPASLTTYRCGQ